MDAGLRVAERLVSENPLGYHASSGAAMKFPAITVLVAQSIILALYPGGPSSKLPRVRVLPLRA